MMCACVEKCTLPSMQGMHECILHGVMCPYYAGTIYHPDETMFLII